MIIPWFAAHVALIVGYLLAILGIAQMLRHRRSPSATIAWLLVFVLFPYVGVALYLVFGGRKVARYKAQTSELLRIRAAVPADARANEISRMLQRYGIAPPTGGNRVTLCPTGVEGLQGLRRIIEETRRTLYVQTFIFSHDDVGRDTLTRLTDKALQGMKVCLLVDGLGSIKTRRSFFEPLVRAGGRFAVFEPVVHLPFRGRTNLRMHRKIAVSDGCRAMAGGMNITGEDMYAEMGPKSWQDLSFIVEGPAARDLEEVLRADWKFVTGQQLQPGMEGDVEARGDATVQVVPSGPNIPNDPLYAATLTAAYRAARRLWIVTPYFVPDDALAQALVIACRRGVDVRILVPEKSNHRLSDVAGAGFLRDIQGAGGRVLLYTGGMVHAKVMIADDELAMVGSANMDMRSLFLDYEVMQLSYTVPEIRDVETWFENLARGCRTGMPEPDLRGQLVEGLVRPVAPLF